MKFQQKDIINRKMTFSLFLMLMIIGLSAGILSGLVGVGGGIIMVPIMLMIGMNQYEAQGTSISVLAIPVTALAALNYYKGGHVDWRNVVVIAMFFVIGGYFGSKYALQLDQKILKKVFGALLLFVGIKMMFGK